MTLLRPSALRARIAAFLVLPLLHACSGGGSAPIPSPAPVPPPVTTAGELTLVAGDIGGPGNLDGTGAAARFDRPDGVAVDAAGTTYVIDRGTRSLRRISADGQVSTLANGVSGTGVALDAAGNAYVADPDSHTIRKVTPAGVVTIAAGIENVAGNTNGAAAQATLNAPAAVAVDGSGNVLIADHGNGLVRKLTPAGQVTTLAGGAPGDCHFVAHGFEQCALPADGVGAAAHFYSVPDIAIGPDGTAYVPDTALNTANLVRRIKPDGTVSTVAISVPGAPSSLALDSHGTLIVVAQRMVYALGADGSATQLAAPAWGVFGPNGAMPSIRVAARPDGRLVLSNESMHRIELVGGGSAATVLAGAAAQAGYDDGPVTSARLFCPSDLAVDAGGNVFVIDYAGQVRKRAADGTVTTVLKSNTPVPPDYNAAERCPATSASLALDAQGSLYVGGYNSLRKVTSAGAVSTLAGGASGPAVDGQGTGAAFFNVAGMVLDRAGTVYLTDWANLVRKVTPAGVVSTLAGVTGLNQPTGIATDAAGNLIVADRGNHAIVKVTPAGVASTIAGAAHTAGYADGPVATAQFRSPDSVAVDVDGSIYVADFGNDMIRRIAPSGVVSTVVGVPGARGVKLGALPASVLGPHGLKWAAPGTFSFATANGIVQLHISTP